MWSTYETNDFVSICKPSSAIFFLDFSVVELYKTPTFLPEFSMREPGKIVCLAFIERFSDNVPPNVFG